MLIRLRRLCVSWLSAALFLSSCGGGTSSSDITAGTPQAGPTAFISSIPLHGQHLREVVAYRFIIQPKPGAASQPVDITYTSAALARRGYLAEDKSTVNLPVFGLYENHNNRVDIHLQFSDGSSRKLEVGVATPPYTGPKGNLANPRFLTKRTPGTELGFDYIFMKSHEIGPAVIDTDGELRWAPPSTINAFSSTFHNGEFIVGTPPEIIGQPYPTEPASLRIHRLGLDGRISTSNLEATNYTQFHHNIDRGKFGLLGEFNAADNGIANVESILAEFTPDGKVLKEWDFAKLLGDYMRSQGDDPSSFIRPGVDWFHMNAATYDPRDDSIIVSSRENFVVKVDYQTGNLIWVFGDPSKYWHSFPSLRAKALRLEPGGLYPIGQHATSITSDGLLMLFNNGRASNNQPEGQPIGEDRAFSAVSAYAIDATNLSAREVWRFDYDQSLLAAYCSSAYEAKNKSILAVYAMTAPLEQPLNSARLVGLDSSRNVVFDFEYESAPCGTSWNAEPLPLESMRIE